MTLALHQRVEQWHLSQDRVGRANVLQDPSQLTTEFQHGEPAPSPSDLIVHPLAGSQRVHFPAHYRANYQNAIARANHGYYHPNGTQGTCQCVKACPRCWFYDNHNFAEYENGQIDEDDPEHSAHPRNPANHQRNVQLDKRCRKTHIFAQSSLHNRGGGMVRSASHESFLDDVRPEDSCTSIGAVAPKPQLNAAARCAGTMGNGGGNQHAVAQHTRNHGRSNYNNRGVYGNNQHGGQQRQPFWQHQGAPAGYNGVNQNYSCGPGGQPGQQPHHQLHNFGASKPWYGNNQINLNEPPHVSQADLQQNWRQPAVNAVMQQQQSGQHNHQNNQSLNHNLNQMQMQPPQQQLNLVDQQQHHTQVMANAQQMQDQQQQQAHLQQQFQQQQNCAPPQQVFAPGQQFTPGQINLNMMHQQPNLQQMGAAPGGANVVLPNCGGAAPPSGATMQPQQQQQQQHVLGGGVNAQMQQGPPQQGTVHPQQAPFHHLSAQQQAGGGGNPVVHQHPQHQFLAAQMFQQRANVVVLQQQQQQQMGNNGTTYVNLNACQQQQVQVPPQQHVVERQMSVPMGGPTTSYTTVPNSLGTASVPHPSAHSMNNNPCYNAHNIANAGPAQPQTGPAQQQFQQHQVQQPQAQPQVHLVAGESSNFGTSSQPQAFSTTTGTGQHQTQTHFVTREQSATRQALLNRKHSSDDDSKWAALGHRRAEMAQIQLVQTRSSSATKQRSGHEPAVVSTQMHPAPLKPQINLQDPPTTSSSSAHPPPVPGTTPTPDPSKITTVASDSEGAAILNSGGGGPPQGVSASANKWKAASSSSTRTTDQPTTPIGNPADNSCMNQSTPAASNVRAPAAEGTTGTAAPSAVITSTEQVQPGVAGTTNEREPSAEEVPVAAVVQEQKAEDIGAAKIPAEKTTPSIVVPKLNLKINPPAVAAPVPDSARSDQVDELSRTHSFSIAPEASEPGILDLNDQEVEEEAGAKGGLGAAPLSARGSGSMFSRMKLSRNSSDLTFKEKRAMNDRGGTYTPRMDTLRRHKMSSIISPAKATRGLRRSTNQNTSLELNNCGVIAEYDEEQEHAAGGKSSLLEDPIEYPALNSNPSTIHQATLQQIGSNWAAGCDKIKQALAARKPVANPIGHNKGHGKAATKGGARTMTRC